MIMEKISSGIMLTSSPKLWVKDGLRSLEKLGVKLVNIKDNHQ